MKKLIALLLCSGVGFLMSCQQQTTADDVVNMLTEASGGAAKLAETMDQVSSWEMTTHIMPPEMPEGMEGPMTMPMTITAKRPNKIRFDTHGPDGNVSGSSCFDGTMGWSMQMGQKKDMPEAQLQETETMAATWLDGFVNHQDKGLTLELLADEMVDEQNYMVLQVTDKHGSAQKYYINPESHYIERQAGEMANMAGGKEQMTMTFKDYKMVEGVAMCHHVAQHNAEGEIIWEATLKEVKHNTGVEDAAFMSEPMSMK